MPVFWIAVRVFRHKSLLAPSSAGMDFGSINHRLIYKLNSLIIMTGMETKRLFEMFSIRWMWGVLGACVLGLVAAATH